MDFSFPPRFQARIYLELLQLPKLDPEAESLAVTQAVGSLFVGWFHQEEIPPQIALNVC
jgi:hypothetical protein